MLVLSNEWLEELYCPKCASLHWCHVIKHDRVNHTVRWAPRELWEQVAHVDPVVANPTASEYSRREAERHRQKQTEIALPLRAALEDLLLPSIVFRPTKPDPAQS